MGEWVEWADDADCPLPWEVVGGDGSNGTGMGLTVSGSCAQFEHRVLDLSTDL